MAPPPPDGLYDRCTLKGKSWINWNSFHNEASLLEFRIKNMMRMKNWQLRQTKILKNETPITDEYYIICIIKHVAQT